MRLVLLLLLMVVIGLRLRLLLVLVVILDCSGGGGVLLLGVGLYSERQVIGGGSAGRERAGREQSHAHPHMTCVCELQSITQQLPSNKNTHKKVSARS